jgi:hypothetical protein
VVTKFFHLATHAYRVHLPGSLSSLQPREGFLVRAEWAPRDRAHPPVRGYADLMAWPELGDLSIEEEMDSILRGTATTLGTRVLEMARLDANARAEGRSLWSGVEEPPRSHYLAGSVTDLESVAPAQLQRCGFRAIKVKWPASLSIASAAVILDRVAPALSEAGLRLRIDFNGTAQPAPLAEFFERRPRLMEAIEFLEDPFPAEMPQWWTEFKARIPQIGLFVDRADEGDRELLGHADGWVIKPALQGPDWISRSRPSEGSPKPLSFTQYLGHAVGSAWTAWHSAQAPQLQLRDSGLLFDSRLEGESEHFAALLRSDSSGFPTARLREGQGIGWTEADFASLTWRSWR